MPIDLSDLATLTISLLLAACYLLPALVAWTRSAVAADRIFIWNILLGWTGVLWLGTLLWALFGERHYKPATFWLTTELGAPTSRYGPSRRPGGMDGVAVGHSATESGKNLD